MRWFCRLCDTKHCSSLVTRVKSGEGGCQQCILRLGWIGSDSMIHSTSPLAKFPFEILNWILRRYPDVRITESCFWYFTKKTSYRRYLRRRFTTVCDMTSLAISLPAPHISKYMIAIMYDIDWVPWRWLMLYLLISSQYSVGGSVILTENLQNGSIWGAMKYPN